MRDWNTGDENGLNSIPSYLDWIDNDEFLNREKSQKDKDDKKKPKSYLDDLPF